MNFSQFRAILSEDRRANANNSKGRIIVTAYRFASFCQVNRGRNLPWKFAAIVVNAIYKIVFDYVMGVYIPVESTIGKGLRVYHGVGIVLHPASILGESCTLRQGVTIGAKDGTDVTVPVIGNNVDIGANAVIIGRIIIGDGATLAAGAVVIKDVPAGAVVVGNPGVVREGGLRGR